MAIDYVKLLSERKVLCDKCKEGYITPINKEIPIDKVNVFRCENCGNQLNITRKLKNWKNNVKLTIDRSFGSGFIFLKNSFDNIMWYDKIKI